MNPLLKISHLHKSFFNEHGETKVIEDLSFDIKQNEVVTLLGPSGCGKSTVLNIISSLESAQGELLVPKNIGYMFQKDNLFPWRTVYKNVLLGLEIKKMKTKENIEYASSLLNKYGLKDFVNHYPDELSGGMRQRASLIRTLVLKPDLLLLDEPFSALDYQTRLSVQEDVKKILLEEKKSALIVTHDISEAIALSSRIFVLTPRPLKLKKEYVLDFPIDSLPSKRREMCEFQTYFMDIFKELHYENT